MNKNSNLQKALKQAFEEHVEPLNEAQWDRLSVAMGEKKPKRKFLPWIFGLIIIIGLSAGLGYWLGNNSGKKENMAGQVIMTKANDDKSQSSTTENNSIQNNKEAGNNNDQDAVLHSDGLNGKTTEEQMGMQKPTPDLVKGNETEAGSDALRGKSSPKGKVNQDGPEGLKKGKSGNSKDKSADFANNGGMEKGNDDPLNKGGGEKDRNVQVDKTVKTGIPENIIMDKEDLIKIKDPSIYKKDVVDEVQKPKDSSKKKNKDAEDDRFRRFAIGFTSGYSQAVYKDVEFTDPKNMHMDTRALYDESVKKTSSRFVNLFFDVRVVKNISLSFNSGVQYREVRSKEDIHYIDNKVTFRDIDGSIYYLGTRPDSFSTLYVVKSTNITRFVAIPLALNYTFPLGKKSEVQLVGGIVLNKIVSGKGKTFSVNERDVVDFNDKLGKKMTMGYLGGLNYYRQIYKPWWIGVGVQMQQNKTQFNTTYGFIKSDINITNYTINIKYKF